MSFRVPHLEPPVQLPRVDSSRATTIRRDRLFF